MTSSAVIYARVSSARQKKDETIGSQTAALRAHAQASGLQVPEEWVFEDEGHTGAGYQIVPGEAALVAELFTRYAEDGASIADLARWMGEQQVPTRTGKTRWDRSVIWGMLRNPAYCGQAVFGKTMVVNESPGLNRRARLQGRDTPRAVKTVDRPREQWVPIPVPGIVTTDTFDRLAER